VQIVATQLKVGNVVIHNGKPYRITHVLHVTPGNWRGMVQTKMVNIETGSNAEHRFRSEDKVDKAELEHHSLQFLYRAGDQYHFMNTEHYEMLDLAGDVVGEASHFLTENMVMEAIYYEGRVVGVEVPMFVELKVTETTPTIKGATAAASPKPAVLETGYEVKVPQYIGIGDTVKIDTRDGSFIERV